MIKKLLLPIILLCSFAPCYSMESMSLEPEICLGCGPEQESYYEKLSEDSVVSDIEYKLAFIEFPDAFNGLTIPFEYVQRLYELQNQ